ncbi:related to Alcohol dehydrogenase 1 [Saccharomycodes ludwigii]|uniref:alcohol dehydrogenase n=1 Tax=Saccharomycodes ludwigii TaxID=36035 RepID=A0A376B3K2_9ASCO|nr:related to Alcohol dehydrogenase 1 [Saccharomycodes ludwigii]
MFKLPKTQRAVVYEKHNGTIKCQDIPIPKPRSNELLVHIKYSGVCASDLHVYKGDWNLSPNFPTIGGHEGAGIVVGMGDQVQNWEIGDLCGIKWIQSTCMKCYECFEGHDIKCKKLKVSGVHHRGTFCEYTTCDATQAAKLSKSKANLAEVAPILCAGLTVYKALKLGKLKFGDCVVIVGSCGGLGSYAVQYAKAMGCLVIGIDNGLKEKFFYENLKGDYFIDFTDMNCGKDGIIKKIQSFTKGNGAKCVLNVSTGKSTFNDLSKMVANWGTIVLVGIPGADTTITYSVLDQVVRCYNIVGSSVGNKTDTKECLRYFDKGLIKSQIKIIGLSELQSAFDTIERGEANGRYVIDTSKLATSAKL